MNVKRLILVLGLAGFIVMADNWVVSPLLPTVAREFSVDPARAGVLIAAYMLPFGLFQLLYGPLADRFGKLRVVTISLALFTVATALCASATGLADLTAFRALTGVFAAATMPVSLALIGDLVPMQGRQKAIATFMGIAFLGQATSMTIGRHDRGPHELARRLHRLRRRGGRDRRRALRHHARHGGRAQGRPSQRVPAPLRPAAWRTDRACAPTSSCSWKAF